jgi:hypothetical protein
VIVCRWMLYCVESLKLAMGSLEMFQEQFRRLKEVEEGKDQLIEVSCLDDYSLFRRQY